MKNCAFLLLFWFCGYAQAAYTVNLGWSTFNGLIAVTNSCADVMAVVIAKAETVTPGYYTNNGCSTNPVAAGTKLYVRTSDPVTNWNVASISIYCAAGTHVDTSTNTCVDDVTIAVASCMPSIRTISPCPSGYAPTNAIPAGSGAPSPYTSAYDGLPIQDMIYAVGIAVCALLGVSVGVKLI